MEESAGQTEVAVLCNVTTIVTFHHLCRVLPLRALLLTLKARGFHEDADNRCVCGEGCDLGSTSPRELCQMFPVFLSMSTNSTNLS